MSRSRKLGIILRIETSVDCTRKFSMLLKHNIEPQALVSHIEMRRCYTFALCIFHKILIRIEKPVIKL